MKKKTVKNVDLKLGNSAKAFSHVKAALRKSNKTGSLLLALRDLAEVRGLSQLSKDSQVDRAHLYSTLTQTGDPRLSTFCRILKAFDLQLSVAPLKKGTTQGSRSKKKS